MHLWDLQGPAPEAQAGPPTALPQRRGLLEACREGQVQGRDPQGLGDRAVVDGNARPLPLLQRVLVEFGPRPRRRLLRVLNPHLVVRLQGEQAYGDDHVSEVLGG